MAAQADRGVPLSTLCPKFLHANSTSHTWPFSAIAELIDNAYDPDVNAKQFWIDKTMVEGQECLSFMDNGNGLDHATMHKMLSFGYSDKTAVKGKEPIGIYGNGFKSGSMRLGRDALVFSKSKTVQCVGMLSQTYLEEINAEQIIVPIVCFEQGERNNLCVKEEYNASLRDILRYSPFKTLAELLLEVNAISSSTMGSTGTRIIIWNLRRASTGTSEFDFETDRYDIRIPSVVYETIKDPEVTSYIPESVFSLRAYCSILYLKPRMQVIIRGQKVKTQLIAKSLAYIRKDHYKPNFLDKHIPITFGYNTKSKDQYGILMYHKNRLIKAYERVGCQLKANIKGVGVIGIIECNFLDPTHNKQSFNETDKYRKTMNSLGTKLEEYWNEIQHKRNKEDPSNTPVEDTMKRPDQTWVQCDECLKWRKLPDGIDRNKLPEKWFCHLNPDPQFRSCQVEEEPEDSDNEQPYRKTYKEQEREEKKKRQKEEEDRKRQEQQRMAQLQRENQELQQQLQQKDVIPPATPSPQRIRLVQASTISQTASSPSTSSSLPVISGVCSLSPSFIRRKRTQRTSPQITSKRQKVNGFHSRILSTSVDIHNSNDSYNTDDELFILENASTPKPQKPIFDLTKIKTEPEENNNRMPLECSSDASTNDALVKKFSGTESLGSAAVETNTTTAPVSAMSSTTTQTEVPKVKKEEDDQDHFLELMQAIAQERDSCQEQVQRLSCQLQEAQKRLNEFTQAKEIKKCSHQFSQTEEPEGGKDHKSLFEKAKQKIGQMIKDKNGSLTTTSTKPNTVQGEESDIDDIAQEVECLLQELEQRNKERDELRSQLNSLEEEKANLASLCEELKLRLQQRENAQERKSSPRATVSSDQTHSENAEGTVAAHRSLISLRQSIGRLLVTFVPALDLSQVNYECDVIDEILEQVLLNVESADDPSEEA